jgi:L,D-transpeptidase ErfK/SrfK
MLFSARKKTLYLVLAFILVLPSWASGQDMFIGGKTTVSAKKGDSLSLIGARFGVDWRIIAKENGFDSKQVYRTGQEFSINNLRIVPKVYDNGIIVNVPDRMLYFFQNGVLTTAFPVGLGLPQEEWQTPIGPFSIALKTTNPTWFIPKSIQKEMEKKGQEVKTIVQPGKDNPLGRYAIRTTLENILIHETIWPTTIYQWSSHGCIRVSPETMERFFDQVETGMTGEIIYQPVNVAVRENRVFLQVTKDIYKKIPSIDNEVRVIVEERGLSDKVDWMKVQDVIKKKTGIAEDVTL